MAATVLFRFDLESPMLRSQQEKLKEVTNMRIKDADNPWRDTPGHGEIGPDVSLYLTRMGEGKWMLDATTHEADWDREAVEATRRRLREVMPEVATTWREVPAALGA
jgi:hypothetical protein